jgi:LysM repeat protein
MQDYTGVVVRGDYNKSSILNAYDGTTGIESEDILDIVRSTNEAQEIATPQPAPVSQPIAPPKTEEKTAPAIDKKRPYYITHLVSKGDTISTIAQKYGVSSEVLRDMNSLSGTHLSINQQLVIPRINGVQYTIQKGDTMSTIAQKYGIKDANSILVVNDLEKGKLLTVGKQLLLPNPTKDPNKKVVVKAPEKKPAPVKKNTPKPVVVKKDAPNTQKTISYGGYSLDLMVEK